MSTAEKTGQVAADGLFAADFDNLRRGQTYTSRPRPIRSSEIAVFAVLSGDHHPIHTDPEWAARGPFGKPIAHGLLVLSCAAGVLPLDPERVLALRRIREVVFKRPLAAGDAIVVECNVAATKPIDEETGLVECEWRIRGEDGRLRVRARVEILWRRGDSDPRANGEAQALGELPLAEPAAERADELCPVQVTEDGLRVLV